MAPRKDQPAVSITVRLPFEAAAALVAYGERQNVTVENFIRSTVLRRLEDVGMVEGIWPQYPDREVKRKRPPKRTNLRPEVV